VKQLGVIYLAFADKVTEAISLDELLRAELVLAVGALDCYVHDLVRIGMGGDLQSLQRRIQCLPKLRSFFRLYEETTFGKLRY
jgi:hypothetical protein